MNAEAAMFACTLQTDPDAVCHTDPLRTVCATVKTTLHTHTDTDMLPQQSEEKVCTETDSSVNSELIPSVVLCFEPMNVKPAYSGRWPC